ncbi:MAG: hypothetical protein EKK54_00170 [Neisseriaceae bacterium]|nr:MAG: hypothetical protein EKK54_00170 [Neisseriaceae bacterium]
MDNLIRQLMDGLYHLLVSKPVDFIFNHSFAIGFLVGVISLVPFAIKRLPHALILLLAMLLSIYLSYVFNLDFSQAFYSNKFYLVAKLVGNYLIGCVFGFSVANLIQRIRGEHDHVINN